MVLLIVFALVSGLRVRLAAHGEGALLSIAFAPPEPPRPKEPKPKVMPKAASAPKGAPAPRGLKNEATPVVAPKVVPLIKPPPVVVATQAGIGQAANNGASDRPGPGQGAGGIGNGLGGGGTGGNGTGGAVVGPRQIRGRLSFSDLPPGLLEPGREASVGVRYVVNVDGRVIDCEADQPSGFPVLDATTCHLIEKRFRFKPARDAQGRPVPATIAESHTWYIKLEDRDR